MGAPTEFTAGDKKTWTETATDSSEIMSYAFQGWEGDVYVVRGVNDGSTHTFTLTQGESAEFVAGWYDVAKVVEDGAGDRTTTRNVAKSQVFADPLIQPDETANARALRKLKAKLEERLSTMKESGGAGGFSESKTAMEAHQALIEKYERRVMREKDARMKALGRPTNNDLIVKF